MSARSDDDQLVHLIRKKPRKKCLTFFAKKSPKERRQFAKLALRTMKEIDKEWLASFSSQQKPLFSKSLEDQLDNAKVCVLATATAGELKKLGWRVIPKDEFVVDVISELEPDWVNQWTQDLSENEPSAYYTIRLLFDAGLCDKPTGDGYILGMIEGLSGWRIAPTSLWDEKTKLAERIRNTPDIRDQDIWRLFAVEGGGELSLSSFEKYVGGKKTGGWAGALLELSEDGTLSRDRLLDESLSALERDFAQFRAGWFSRFHEAMKPTLQERVTRRDQYLRLLSSSIPPTVSFSLKAILQLDKADELPPSDVIEHIKPVLQARAKGTVSTGLRLIANSAKRAPELAVTASRTAATALIHEAADIQKKALDLIDSLNGTDDADVVVAIADYADGVAPSLRSRVSAMIGDAGRALTTDEPDCGLAQGLVSRIEPIDSFDELNQEFLLILEDTSQPLQVERVIDGLARFGADKPQDFKKAVGPLLKRSVTIIKRHPDDQIQYQMARLAYAFASYGPLTAEDTFRYPDTDIAPYSQGREREHRSFEDTFLGRNVDVLTQVRADHRLPLLSAPTDSRGFVAVEALLSRYSLYKSERVNPGSVDTALALMRLSPDGRDDAVKALKPDDEYECAFAYAIGADLKSGRTKWLWVAAAAARIPYVDEPEVAKNFGSGFPDAGMNARYAIAFEKINYFTWLLMRVDPKIKGTVPNAFLATMFHLTSAGDNSYGSVCGYHVNMIRWCATVWPLNTEPFFSQGVLVFDPSQRLANSPYAGFLEPMLKAHIAIGEIGSFLLALGLASSDPAIKSVAVEAAISAIEEDRLDLEALRQAFATLIPSRYVPVRRWTKSLMELSGVSTKHTIVVRDLLEGSFRHDPAKPPRDIGGLIELLYELSIALESAVTDIETLNYLRGVTGGGKLKRFASKLIAQADTAQ